MKLSARIRRIERQLALPEPEFVKLTPEDRQRLGRLFVQVEKRNGAPPISPKGFEATHLESLAQGIDSCPAYG